jgi:hypothetical protein
MGCPAEVHEPVGGRPGKRQQDRANGQPLTVKHLKSLDKFRRHGALAKAWSIPRRFASSLC